MTWSASGRIDDPARQCDGKRTYGTRAEAKAAIKSMLGHGRGKLQAYRCGHCGSLHLGHAPAGPRSRRAA